MRKEISSPAIRVEIPENPFSYIDCKCIADNKHFVDKMGNTFNCENGINFWTDGIAGGKISLDQSPINSELFSLSICFSGGTKYPVVFGDIETNGIWIEIRNNFYLLRNNMGTMFSQEFKNKFTFAFTKNGSHYLFFNDGILSGESFFSTKTTNVTTIQANSNDRLINLIMYNRLLSDLEVKDLYLLDFKSSSGIDHLGFKNSVQSFSMEI